MQRVVLQSTLEKHSNWNTMQLHSDTPSASMHTTLDFFLNSEKTAASKTETYLMQMSQTASSITTSAILTVMPNWKN